jgi:hypothetical protein
MTNVSHVQLKLVNLYRDCVLCYGPALGYFHPGGIRTLMQRNQLTLTHRCNVCFIR